MSELSEAKVGRWFAQRNLNVRAYSVWNKKRIANALRFVDGRITEQEYKKRDEELRSNGPQEPTEAQIQQELDTIIERYRL